MKTCPHCGGSLEEEAASPQGTFQLISTEAPPAAVIMLPIVGGKEHPIYEPLIRTWKMAYPGIDVLAELNKFRAWSLSNPKKQKTSTGIARAANSWLSRAQNDLRGSNGNGRRPYGFEAEREQIARVIGSRG